MDCVYFLSQPWTGTPQTTRAWVTGILHKALGIWNTFSHRNSSTCSCTISRTAHSTLIILKVSSGAQRRVTGSNLSSALLVWPQTSQSTARNLRREGLCLLTSEDRVTMDTWRLGALRIPRDTALHPEGKHSKDSLELNMLQIGDPNPCQQNMWYSLLAT